MTENKDKKIYILIPAFNEESQIGRVISSLKERGFTNILVINDGSRDKTEQIAMEAGAEVLNHIINRGQGAALRTGIEYLRETATPDIIITFDADGQHRPEDIPALVDPILKGEADIVLGSRFLKEKSNIPPIRKLVLKAGILFTNFISRINLTDTHNGFRALGKKAIEKIKITHRGMEHASDIIDEIPKNKLRYKEVPVEIIYTDYSKMKGQKTSNFIKMGIKIIIKKIS
ncbi:MAG TPA: glycosyltransferase family 2 protein [Candidatus Moranbacteria bacterium]|nr:glycosyltransferase family 2 protein [Candidatus Moranbacteria bacterium]